MAEHVPGAPDRYKHGWIPVDAVDRTKDGSGMAALSRMAKEATPQPRTEVHDIKRVRDRKALMADTPDEIMRSVIDNRGGNRVAVFRNERNEVVGAANFNRDHYGKENGLVDMRVNREARGHGAGHKLISAVAQDAQAASKGKNDWGMNVTNALDSAVPFYAQTGARFRNENSSVGYWDAAATNAAAASRHVDNRGTLTPKQVARAAGGGTVVATE